MSARRKSILALILVPVIVLLSVVAVGVASASRSPASTHKALTAPTITISMFAFTTPANIPAGARIKVVNKDSAAHTVTSDKAGKFDVNVPGKTTVFFKAPKRAGNYKFHCTFHSTMHGVLHVT